LNGRRGDDKLRNLTPRTIACRTVMITADRRAQGAGSFHLIAPQIQIARGKFGNACRSEIVGSINPECQRLACAQVPCDPLKPHEGGVDMNVVGNRLRSKLPVRDPLWWNGVAARFGFPVLGLVVAVIVGWTISHL
jgi:hypothetical protein